MSRIRTLNVLGRGRSAVTGGAGQTGREQRPQADFFLASALEGEGHRHGVRFCGLGGRGRRLVVFSGRPGPAQRWASLGVLRKVLTVRAIPEAPGASDSDHMPWPSPGVFVASGCRTGKQVAGDLQGSRAENQVAEGGLSCCPGS